MKRLKYSLLKYGLFNCDLKFLNKIFFLNSISSLISTKRLLPQSDFAAWSHILSISPVIELRTIDSATVFIFYDPDEYQVMGVLKIKSKE